MDANMTGDPVNPESYRLTLYFLVLPRELYHRYRGAGRCGINRMESGLLPRVTVGDRQEGTETQRTSPPLKCGRGTTTGTPRDRHSSPTVPSGPPQNVGGPLPIYLLRHGGPSSHTGDSSWGST